MIYHRLAVKREVLLANMSKETPKAPFAEEIGRTRHDARKTLSSLTAMVNALAPENAGRIIEDINRENNFPDEHAQYVPRLHGDGSTKCTCRNSLWNGWFPTLKTCGEEVILNIVFAAPNPVVFGHWLNISRTLVNLASNSIDSMTENTGPKKTDNIPVARRRR